MLFRAPLARQRMAQVAHGQRGIAGTTEDVYLAVAQLDGTQQGDAFGRIGSPWKVLGKTIAIEPAPEHGGTQPRLLLIGLQHMAEQQREQTRIVVAQQPRIAAIACFKTAPQVLGQSLERPVGSQRQQLRATL
ncbi:hypothetical protein D3C76_1371010 [compost metagenome]